LLLQAKTQLQAGQDQSWCIWSLYC